MSESREDQFSALYDSTRSLIFAYVLRRAQSPEDAADVVAEIFEIAWRRYDTIPSDRGAVLWLYVTARYVLANQARRTRRRDDTVTALGEELRSALRVEPLDEESVAMEACLKVLPEEDREILMLAGWEGLNASELGRVLGCSPTAARIRLHRARSRLRDEMAERPKHTKRSPVAGHEQEKKEDEDGQAEEVLNNDAK